MRGRKEKSCRKKGRILTLGLALGIICLGCASPPRKPEAPPPPPPPRVESAPAAPKPQPAPLKPEPAPRQPSTVQEKPAPPRPKPAPPPPIQAPPEPEPEPVKTSYVHRVKWEGETLSMIAAWYTGDWKNWKALVQANPKIIPNRIYEGNEIVIPESLLVTREHMPKEFVDRFYSKGKKEKSLTRPQPIQGQEEEPKLFGPKKYPTR